MTSELSERIMGRLWLHAHRAVPLIAQLRDCACEQFRKILKLQLLNSVLEQVSVARGSGAKGATQDMLAEGHTLRQARMRGVILTTTGSSLDILGGCHKNFFKTGAGVKACSPKNNFQGSNSFFQPALRGPRNPKKSSSEKLFCAFQARGPNVKRCSRNKTSPGLNMLSSKPAKPKR